MLTAVFVSLATLVLAGWLNARAFMWLAFAAILGGAALLVASDSTPVAPLGASVLMASGSVALASLHFRLKVRLAFGVITALPFAFVAFAAWPLTRVAETSATGSNLMLLALAGVVALIALALGRPTPANPEAPTS